MKKVLFFFCFLFVWAVVNVSCVKQQGDTFKVGALLPMTGSGALYGQYAMEGMQIAVDEVNSSGGISSRKMEIVLEDNQSNAKSGVSAFQSLIQKNVTVALTEFSPVVVACSPIANETKTVLLNCGAQTPKIREGGPFVFSVIIDANVEAENMARFLADSLKIMEVCTYVINTETGINTEKVFAEFFQKFGGTILLREVHDQGSVDFRTTLSKIKKTHTRAVYLVSLVRESAQILKQAAEIGLRTQWLSYASFQGPDLVKVAGTAAEGAIYTYPFFDTSNVQARNFRKSYFNKYQREPDIYASTFYDGVKMVEGAFKANKIKGEEIRQYIKAISFEGVTGKTEYRDGNWVEKSVEFRTIRNGEFVRHYVYIDSSR